MRNPLPHLSYAERIARAGEKKQKILGFLADYEVFTTPAVVAQLLRISVVNARRCLSLLEGEGMLKRERHFIDGRQCDIFGITQNGLVAVAADVDAPVFELGRSKSSYLIHKLEVQRIRLVCESLGGSFITERKLRIAGYKKIPDGMWISPFNGRIAIEVEREAKTLKRMREILTRHIVQIEADESYDMVLYLVPDHMRRGMVKLLQSVNLPEAPDRDDLCHKRLYRFAMASLQYFPNGVNEDNKDKVKKKVKLEPEFLHIDEKLKFERLFKPEELD